MTEQTPRDRWLDKPPDDNLLKEIIRQLRLFWRLLRDRRVPVWTKAIPFISLAYLLVPVDLVPDVLVGLGQLDDLAVVALGYRLFLELVPPTVVREHLRDLIASAAEWRVVDDDGEPVKEIVEPASGWTVIDGQAEPIDDAHS